jgi:hypothetical protein
VKSLKTKISDDNLKLETEALKKIKDKEIEVTDYFNKKKLELNDSLSGGIKSL